MQQRFAQCRRDVNDARGFHSSFPKAVEVVAKLLKIYARCAPAFEEKEALPIVRPASGSFVRTAVEADAVARAIREERSFLMEDVTEIDESVVAASWQGDANGEAFLRDKPCEKLQRVARNAWRYIERAAVALVYQTRGIKLTTLDGERYDNVRADRCGPHKRRATR